MSEDDFESDVDRDPKTELATLLGELKKLIGEFPGERLKWCSRYIHGLIQALEKDHGTLAVLGTNGTGKSHLLNLLLFWTEASPDSYRRPRSSDYVPEGLQGRGRVKREYRLLSRKAAEYRQQSLDLAELEWWKNFRQLCSAPGIHFGRTYLLPSKNGPMITTNTVTRVRYGETYQVQVTFKSESEMKDEAKEYLDSLRSGGRGDHHALLENMWNIYTTTPSRDVSRDGAAPNITLRREFQAVAGRTELFIGLGEHRDTDRLFVREVLENICYSGQAQMASHVKDVKDAQEECKKNRPNARKRFQEAEARLYAEKDLMGHARCGGVQHAIKRLTVFVPSSLLIGGGEMQDIPGTNDSDLFRKELTAKAIREVDTLLVLVPKDMAASHDVHTALTVSESFLKRLANGNAKRLVFARYPEKDSAQTTTTISQDQGNRDQFKRSAAQYLNRWMTQNRLTEFEQGAVTRNTTFLTVYPNLFTGIVLSSIGLSPSKFKVEELLPMTAGDALYRLLDGDQDSSSILDRLIENESQRIEDKNQNTLIMKIKEHIKVSTVKHKPGSENILFSTHFAQRSYRTTMEKECSICHADNRPEENIHRCPQLPIFESWKEKLLADKVGIFAQFEHDFQGQRDRMSQTAKTSWRSNGVVFTRSREVTNVTELIFPTFPNVQPLRDKINKFLQGKVFPEFLDLFKNIIASHLLAKAPLLNAKRSVPTLPPALNEHVSRVQSNLSVYADFSRFFNINEQWGLADKHLKKIVCRLQRNAVKTMIYESDLFDAHPRLSHEQFKAKVLDRIPRTVQRFFNTLIDELRNRVKNQLEMYCAYLFQSRRGMKCVFKRGVEALIEAQEGQPSRGAQIPRSIAPPPLEASIPVGWMQRLDNWVASAKKFREFNTFDGPDLENIIEGMKNNFMSTIVDLHPHLAACSAAPSAMPGQPSSIQHVYCQGVNRFCGTREKKILDDLVRQAREANELLQGFPNAEAMEKHISELKLQAGRRFLGQAHLNNSLWNSLGHQLTGLDGWGVFTSDIVRLHDHNFDFENSFESLQACTTALQAKIIIVTKSSIILLKPPPSKTLQTTRERIFVLGHCEDKSNYGEFYSLVPSSKSSPKPPSGQPSKRQKQ